MDPEIIKETYMFKIVWDKKEIERCIRENEGDQHFLDFLVPIHLFIKGVEITRADDIRGAVKSHFWNLSLNWLFVLKSIDPEKLKDVEFNFSSNVNNEISGWDFEFFIDNNKQTDVIMMRYKDHSLQEYRIIEIPLKDYVESILSVNTEMIDFIGKIAPGHDDFGVYQSLKDGTKIVSEWYRERYHLSALSKL